MASVNVTIRMDENDKKNAEKLFSDLGLTMNAAFNMFAKQAVREQGIPFKVTKNTEVQFMNRNMLDELSDKSDNKYQKAYEELAK
jgi:DNA-damage-inducible protein J